MEPETFKIQKKNLYQTWSQFLMYIEHIYNKGDLCCVDSPPRDQIDRGIFRHLSKHTVSLPLSNSVTLQLYFLRLVPNMISVPNVYWTSTIIIYIWGWWLKVAVEAWSFRFWFCFHWIMHENLVFFLCFHLFGFIHINNYFYLLFDFELSRLMFFFIFESILL